MVGTLDHWKGKGLGNFVNLKNKIGIVDTVAREIKQNRTTVIDCMSELLVTHKNEEVIDLVSTMIAENRGTGQCHFILLTEGMQNKQVETAMEHFAEGVIILNTTWSAESTNRSIMIKKLAGIPVSKRRLPYSLGKKGFIIETATRIT